MIIYGTVASQQSISFEGPPPPEGTTWRILITNTQGLAAGTPVRIQEVVWLNAAGAPISLTGASHLANHWDGPNGPNNCFDTDPETFWNGFRDDGTFYGINAWLQTKWTGTTEVRGVKITTASDAPEEAPRTFSIQYETPNGSWITLFSIVDQVDWDVQELRRFQMDGRVWRLAIGSTAEGTNLAIGEIEFRSVANVSERHNAAGGFPLVDHQVVPETRFQAFDNDIATAWASDVLPARIEYWFPVPKDVAQVAVFSVGDRPDQAPADMQLFFSDDYGESFTEAGSVPIVTISSGYGYGYGYFYGGN